MFIKGLACLWLPVLFIILSIMNIVKPFKIKGALVIKGSRKNENTWSFTQRFYSIFLLILCLVLLVIASIFLHKTIANQFELRGASRKVSFLALLLALIPIPFTKLALLKKFDKEGNYKK